MYQVPFDGRKTATSDLTSPSTSVMTLGRTVSTAALLIADPTVLVATHRYCVLSRPTVAPVIERAAVLVPLYGGTSLRFVHETPAFVDNCHRYVSAPLVVTVSCVFCPGITR
jgi:hypothetical protein